MKKILFLMLSMCGILGAADVGNGIASGQTGMQAGYRKYFEKDYAGAVIECTNELKRDKENARAYFLRGMARYDAGEKEDALKDFAAAKRLDASFSKEIERTLRK
ncbi:MAG: hypothetical protein LBD62_00970 [Candidatus Margulisbacteria bacterium]|jgi:tetratricopeptide (TPR) repeat protein|nr:hypothetical protein [Candidatus Margulisiibacteriota bacterium]